MSTAEQTRDAETSAAQANRTALLISSDQRQSAGVKVFQDALLAGGIIPIHRTCAPAKVNDLILAMRGQVQSVLLVGGDGLLGQGAIALRDTGLPLGLFPQGASTELARRLQISTDPEEAAAIILAGHKRHLNLATVNGRPFFSVATIGLTAEDARDLNRAAHHALGRIAFTWKALGLSFRSNRFAAVVRCDADIHRVRSLQITIGNGHTYSSGMMPGTERPGNNGTLGLYSLEPAGFWRLPRLRHAFIAPEQECLREARYVEAAVVEVVTRLPRPISADGEIVAMTPARFSMLHQAIEIFVPASTPPSQPRHVVP